MRPDDTIDPAEAHRIEAVQMSEKTFQQRIRNLAEEMGWRVYAVYDSRKTPAGWPDLTLVKGERLCFWELKSQRGKTTESQNEWLAELAATGAETAVYRPADYELIVRMLNA